MTEYSYEGSGTTATEPFTISGDGPVEIAVSHKGQSNFIVWLKTGDGQDVDLVANAIGDYQGATMHALDPGSYMLDVDADGDWAITVRHLPVYQSGQSLPLSESGGHPTVLGPIKFPGGVRVEFNGQGEENHIVWLKDATGQDTALLFNEIGSTGSISTVVNASGIGFVEITSPKWSISLKST